MLQLAAALLQLPLLQGGSPADDSLGGALLRMLPLFIILYVIIYLMLIRPQRREQERHLRVLESLKKNDQVQTSGGFLGRVVSVDKDKDQVVLKVDDQNNVRMRVLRSSIVAVLNDDKNKKEATPARS